MTAPARVLIVDDSVVIRRLVSEALGAAPQIEIVGKAANGRIALEKIQRLDPDVVVLDVEMPEMSGLEALEEIRKLKRRPKVIMFSTLCEQGAAVTVKALALGASDYVTKPSNVGGISEGRKQVQDRMVPKILALVPRLRSQVAGASVTGLPRPRPTSVLANARIDALLIGSSTGGPNALAEVVPHLGADLPVPVLIVQHMPPMFTRYLAERLDSLSPYPVVEAVDGMPIQAGHVYVAPGGLHLGVREVSPERRVCHIHEAPPENSCRPAVDVLFRSGVAAWGQNVLGVVLTGMGKDGLAGCQGIKEAGGQVLSQDEETSVIWGMPGWVAKEGATDRILPLGKIAPEIERRLWRHRRRVPTARPTSEKRTA